MKEKKSQVISIVAAMGKNRVIGKNGKLPWEKIPSDLKRFRKLTWGKPVIMGRKTCESLGAPLAERTNIVLTKNPQFDAKGFLVMDSMETALAIVEASPEVMVIGGGEIYAFVLPLAQKMYLTLIDADFEGDTFFPDYDPRDWIIWEEQNYAPDEKSPYPLKFLNLVRRS